MEAKDEPVDIVILTNGPGEVATWVKPVVATLRQSSKEQGIDMRISVNTLQIFTPYNVKGFLGTVDFALQKALIKTGVYITKFRRPNYHVNILKC